MHLPRLAPAVALALCGCFSRLEVAGGAGVDDDTAPTGDAGGDDASGGGDEGGGDGGDDGGGPLAPGVSSVDPAHGSTAGGRVVRLSGAHLDPGARVYFGAAEATVQNRGDTVLDVVVPAAAGGAGVVDVRVETDAGADTAAGAFTYWQDASGQAVVHVRGRVLELRADTGTTTDFYALGAHTSPVDAWLTDLQAAQGACAASFPADADLLDGPSALVLEGGAGRFDLTWDAGDRVHTHDDSVTSVDDLKAAALRVSAPSGGAWPAFEAPAALGFPSYVRLFSPDPNSPGSHVDRDNLQVTWTATDADRVMVGLQDAVTGNVLVCATRNTGAFAVPDSIFDSFEPYASEWWTDYYVVQFTLVAYRDTATTLPFNNGELRAQGGIGYSVMAVVEDSTW